MGAVYRKEMRGCFTNMTGAIAVAASLLIAGLMFRYYNLYYGVLTLHYAVSNCALIFYIVVPILSMRVFAEERRQRTDQLLFTSPESVFSIVMGKYLALVSILAIPTAVMCFFPLIMRAFGAETLGWDYACILAWFLMGAAYLAVGMFISSCTESAVIAAILSILFVFLTQMLSGVFTILSTSAVTTLLFLIVLGGLAGLLMYFMTKHVLISAGLGGGIAAASVIGYLVRPDWFSGRTESILRVLDFSTHFSDFAGGSLSIGNLLFFVSYIVIGIGLTVQSIEKRRWS